MYLNETGEDTAEKYGLTTCAWWFLQPNLQEYFLAIDHTTSTGRQRTASGTKTRSLIQKDLRKKQFHGYEPQHHWLPSCWEAMFWRFMPMTQKTATDENITCLQFGYGIFNAPLHPIACTVHHNILPAITCLTPTNQYVVCTPVQPALKAMLHKTCSNFFYYSLEIIIQVP